MFRIMLVCSDVMSKIQNQIPITLLLNNSFPPLIIGAAFSIHCISTAFPAYKWNFFTLPLTCLQIQAQAQTLYLL